MAIEAGCDMLYCSGDFKKAYNGILDAVQNGKIEETRINESLMRIYRVKYSGDARTVDVHVRRLREKIELHPSDPKYIHTT